VATKRRAAAVAVALILLAGIAVAQPSYEGNPDFSLPGRSGSPPAIAGLPGPSFAAIYYRSLSDAQTSKDPILGGVIDTGVVNEVFGPTYRLEAPALASIGLLRLAGYFEGVMGATLTGPLGQTISGSRSVTS
jgi:hypothetical protein